MERESMVSTTQRHDSRDNGSYEDTCSSWMLNAGPLFRYFLPAVLKGSAPAVLKQEQAEGESSGPIRVTQLDNPL